MLKRLFLMLFFGISLIQFTAVSACSGGMPTTLPELVDNASVIVQGQMLMVDERGQNGVFQVESVFSKGYVPQFILLDLAPSSFIYREQERFSGGGCFHGVNPLHLNQTIIFFLQKMPNGAYQLASRHYSNPEYYPFPNDDSTVPIYSTPPNTTPDQTSIRQSQLVNLQTFIRLITGIVGQSPHAPQMNTPYPLPTSLYIRTEAGTEYALPVDFSPPVKLTPETVNQIGTIVQSGCISVYCIGTSPNGIDSAQVMPDSTVQILSFTGSSASGTAFQFSTTSDALAVWNTNTLTVYALPYNRLGFCCYNLTLINSINLANPIKNVTAVAWSPDGRLIAYNDATGLYLWDAFTSGSRPHLLAAPLYSTITPRFFSTTGRYLAVQRGQNRFYMDMISGLEVSDGAISPDDRNLLQYDTQRPSPLRLYRLAPYLHKDLLTDYKNVRQAQWIDQSNYLVAGCNDLHPNECHIWQGGLLIGGGQYDGFDFTYDKVTDTLAIAMSGKRIGIINQTGALKTYDFGASLDSEIETIEWMKPIFFQP